MSMRKLFLISLFTLAPLLYLAAPPTCAAQQPKLAVYQALARFGTSVDFAMFNLDLNYSISMNSATTTSYRTGYHQVQFNLAYVF